MWRTWTPPLDGSSRAVQYHPVAKKRRKRKKGGKTGGSGSGGGPSASGGGGVMQSIRSGFKRAAGVEESKEKPSTLSNILWMLVLLAAIGVFLYRWYG